MKSIVVSINEEVKFMKSKEVNELAKHYLEDSENDEDFHLFSINKDEQQLSKVVFAWACSKGVDKPKAKQLAIYMIELGHQKFGHQ